MLDRTKTKVLIVADKPPPQDLQDLLKNRNCALVISSKQDEALNLLLTDVFHIVFIDCILSSGEGTFLIKPIRKALGSSVEIVLTSKLFKESDLTEFIVKDNCFFLEKPFSISKAEKLLNRIQRKTVSKGGGELLSRMFGPSILQDLDRCKWLISLKEVSGVELFIYLNSALLSKEACQISFGSGEKSGSLNCYKGVITSFYLEQPQFFLNQLLAQKAISTQTAEQLSSLSQKECERELLKNCHLSPSMLSSCLKDILTSSLKTISKDMKIPFQADILKSSQLNSSPEKEGDFSSPLLSVSREEFCELIFHLLPEAASLSSLFNEGEMSKSLIFSKSLRLDNVFGAVGGHKALAEKLLSGKSLQQASLDFPESKNEFYAHILYLLLKSLAKLPPIGPDSSFSLNVSYQSLYERYKNLYHFACESSPKKFFSTLQGFPNGTKITAKELDEVYFKFVKHNHPDKINSDNLKDLSSLAHKTFLKIKGLYETLSLELNSKAAKKNAKEEQLLTLQKQSILSKNIEDKNYKQAMDIIKSLPEEEKERYGLYKLFYLWIHLEAKDQKLSSKEKAQEYMRSIQSKVNIFSKEKLYNFTLGLYHENRKNYKQAKLFFQNAKAIDPSFKPAYRAAGRCHIKLVQQNKEKGSSNSFKALTEKLLKKLNNKKTG